MSGQALCQALFAGHAVPQEPHTRRAFYLSEALPGDKLSGNSLLLQGTQVGRMLEGPQDPQAGGSGSQGPSTPGQAHRRWGGERRRSQRDRPEARRGQKALRTKSRRAAGGAGRGHVQPLKTTVMQALEVKPHPPCDLVTPLLGEYTPETRRQMCRPLCVQQG